MGTVSQYNQECDKVILGKDNRAKKKYNQELEDIDILKKSYVLLMEIWIYVKFRESLNKFV